MAGTPAASVAARTAPAAAGVGAAATAGVGAAPSATRVGSSATSGMGSSASRGGSGTSCWGSGTSRATALIRGYSAAQARGQPGRELGHRRRALQGIPGSRRAVAVIVVPHHYSGTR